ncbi:hypothetical protein BC938DRAFT_480891 [Jimgerdemannia flammicorona]|uniref:Uncharacterized protein n=1 Tax=Jimgerdemannia flammicorona TaxID=994334 RepID=A0A433QHF4_9FUNG|nr:hypothetical protein BC938DRAFT_480891 [Jimgerdemannia flammicorona]
MTTPSPASTGNSVIPSTTSSRPANTPKPSKRRPKYVRAPSPFPSLLNTASRPQPSIRCLQGSLSLVILLDQISRNIYRNSPRCFVDADPLARKFTKAVFARGFDQELEMIERVWFYMPLEHSEDKADHELCITKFEMAVDNAPEIHLPFIESMFKYAKDHKVVIDKFGRYPHRNRILGRVNTPEEEEWLKTGKGW